MLRSFLFILVIFTVSLTALAGCDQPSTASKSKVNQTDAEPSRYIDLSGIHCPITVDNSYNADGKQNFVMTIVCDGKELFHIDIEGSLPTEGSADGVDVDVFGNNFFSWGTKK